MYVFLKEGPVHIVQHRNDDTMMIVRGWSKPALVRFLARQYDTDMNTPTASAEISAIYYDDSADYCWRAEVPRFVVERCMKYALDRLTYDSLKSGVAADGNHEYYDQLVQVHGLCKALMDPRRQA